MGIWNNSNHLSKICCFADPSAIDDSAIIFQLPPLCKNLSLRKKSYRRILTSLTSSRWRSDLAPWKGPSQSHQKKFSPWWSLEASCLPLQPSSDDHQPRPGTEGGDHWGGADAALFAQASIRGNGASFFGKKMAIRNQQNWRTSVFLGRHSFTMQPISLHTSYMYNYCIYQIDLSNASIHLSIHLLVPSTHCPPGTRSSRSGPAGAVLACCTRLRGLEFPRLLGLPWVAWVACDAGNFNCVNPRSKAWISWIFLENSHFFPLKIDVVGRWWDFSFEMVPFWKETR